jgi:hypothetical protein
MANLYSQIVRGDSSTDYTFGANAKGVTENVFNIGTPALAFITIAPSDGSAVDLGSAANRALILAGLNNAGVEVYGFGEVDSSSPYDVMVIANNNTLTTAAKIETSLIASVGSAIDANTTITIHTGWLGNVTA